jgi:hypothetical protein
VYTLHYRYNLRPCPSVELKWVNTGSLSRFVYNISGPFSARGQYVFVCLFVCVCVHVGSGMGIVCAWIYLYIYRQQRPIHKDLLQRPLFHRIYMRLHHTKCKVKEYLQRNGRNQIADGACKSFHDTLKLHSLHFQQSSSKGTGNLKIISCITYNDTQLHYSCADRR